MGRLAGKVIMITGAARGQGAAQARRFAAEGASVVLGDVLDDAGAAVAAEIGDAAAYVRLDVRSETDWAAAVAYATDRHGRLDGLVNNAGIVLYKTLERTTADEYRDLVSVNQLGVFLGMRAVVAPLRAARGGTIVNVASIGGLSGIAGMSAYCATKFAVVGMTRAAAAELGPSGIRVTAICPGHIDTPMTDTPGQNTAALARALPLRRIGTVADVAGLAVFLCSDESAYCTGAEFVIDGGRLAGGI
jgi:3alpha(or 20beta)-hydroxysteroid dehydrogenase